MGENDNMAKQLVADLYGCSDLINDSKYLIKAAHEAIAFVNSNIVEECIHEFKPIGITYFAVISKSHFSIHTWPEYGYVAIDIFSCDDDVIEGISQKLKELFQADEVKMSVIDRIIR